MPIKMFNWYGSKQRVLSEIHACVPSSITSWYDACMGSAVVTLNAPQYPVEVMSDLDDDLVHLFGLLSEEIRGKELVERLVKIPYSEDIFKKAISAKNKGYCGMDDFQRAEAIFVSISQSFNNTRKCFRKPRKGFSQHEYTSELLANVPDVYKRLQGVSVLKRDCVDVVTKVKHDPHAFVFLDVPYRWELRSAGATNVYGHEMDENAHIQLLKECRNAECCIMLCGYRQTTGKDLYDQHLGVGKKDSSWRSYTLSRLVKSCQVKRKKDVATETIWVNYELPPCAKYYIDTSENT